MIENRCTRTKSLVGRKVCGPGAVRMNGGEPGADVPSPGKAVAVVEEGADVDFVSCAADHEGACADALGVGGVAPGDVCPFEIGDVGVEESRAFVSGVWFWNAVIRMCLTI